jgi:DNA primase
MTLKKAGKNYSGLCPFHNEKTPSFSVSPDKQFFHCFGCQESGTALGFVMLHDRLDFVEAVEALAGSIGLDVPREKGFSTKENKADGKLLEALLKATEFFKNHLRGSESAKKYLKGRGISGALARDFQLGYAPTGWQVLESNLNEVTKKSLLDAGLVSQGDNGKSYDRFRDRIMFPIRNTRGQIIGFGGRLMSSDGGPKYLNSPETEAFKKGEELYGLYEARKSQNRLEKIVVVEGYMDVLSLVQSGIANVVATLGTATNEIHFQKLFRHTNEIVLCFDGDSAGRQAGWKALERAVPALTDQKQVKLVFLPEGEDPDTLVQKLGLEDFERLLQNSTPGLDYLVRKLSDGLDLDSLDDRAKFFGLCQPYVEKMKEGILRDLFQQKVSNIAGLKSGSAGGQQKRVQPRQGASKVSKLEIKLCRYVLKFPDLWSDIKLESKEDYLCLVERTDLMGKIIRELQSGPCKDSEELLVRLMDEPNYQYLIDLARKSLEIDVATIEVEFQEGLNRLLMTVKKEDKRKMLENLNQSSSISELKEFVSLRERN